MQSSRHHQKGNTVFPRYVPQSWESKIPPQSYTPQEIAGPNKALLGETNG